MFTGGSTWAVGADPIGICVHAHLVLHLQTYSQLPAPAPCLIYKEFTAWHMAPGTWGPGNLGARDLGAREPDALPPPGRRPPESGRKPSRVRPGPEQYIVHCPWFNI